MEGMIIGAVNHNDEVYIFPIGACRWFRIFEFA